MITLTHISKRIGGRTLFEEVTMTFNEGCRYGLTGPNGSGKSTLLKILMGLEESTSGHVSLPNRVGYLKQNIEEFKDYLVIDTVIQGNDRLFSALQEREGLYEEEMTDEVGVRLGELEEIIGEEDGYEAETKAEELLRGMGIPEGFFRQKMGTIPQDLQFRVLLCQAIFGSPQALILDEPTNHLDLESIGWLETFLMNYSGTLIVVSHDRHFLNSVATDIADIDYETIIVYPGNYDEMLVSKTAVRERTEAENKTKEKKVSQLREFVSRFGAGTRASQVQSRIKEIERLQPQELKKSNIVRPYIRFYPPEKQSGHIVFKVERVSKAYEGPSVIDHLFFEVLRQDKIALIGNNGLGKSTLLKMLAHVLPQDSGLIETGHGVEIGYFPQNHLDLISKRADMTAFEWLKGCKERVYDQDVRSILGKLLFSGDDAFKPLSALSGGERARLLIGNLMLCNFNTLILDEPDNHLDLEAVSALSWALEEYKGTILFASHNRDLITKTATKILAFEKKKIRLFAGTYEEYLSEKGDAL